MQLTRALLVNATKGSDMLVVEVKDNKSKMPDDGSDTSLSSHGLAKEGFASLEDHPQTRACIRRVMLAASILFWAAIIMGIVAGVDYQNALHSGAHADLVRQLWYASTVLGLILLSSLAVGAVWACFGIPRVPRSSVMLIVLVAALASTVAIYRLVVMRFSTTSLLSDAPGSLNSLDSKITFYVFQSAPEYLAAAILITLDVRRIFATGLWGDRQFRDPQPKV
ncbi:hypothetical protein L227DRAFT_613399 [Lentinus tigrinus ALCF2SS1-6]|uniref:Uncharacterized protein n=2 Tax=Lentinus tigrinus TaxID=5365 RepID=A0A5C2S2K1_9APHY|nr:hypothetical protein L227DRAFT_613399 [Lentinus tigrinus ALCF2SS1-6]